MLARFGVTGAPLDFFEAITFCIANGIAVDHTIHRLARCCEAVQAGLPPEDAVVVAPRSAMTPIIWNSLVLAGGFLVLLGSELPANAAFGLLTAVIVLTALAVDLVFTPVALITVERAAVTSPARRRCSRDTFLSAGRRDPRGTRHRDPIAGKRA